MEHIGIFAGNPKVEKYHDEVVVTDAQLIAFQEAMKLADSVRDQVLRVVVAFDHAGKFGDQFLDPAQSIPKRKWRRLRLSHLHPAIREEYEPLLTEHDMFTEDIGVYTEDYLRFPALQNSHDRRVVRPAMPPKILCFDALCDEQKEHYRTHTKPKVNCRGVTAAIIEKVSRDCDEAFTFWEHDRVRVKEDVIDEGTQLAYEIFNVRSNIVSTLLYDGGTRQRRIEYGFDAQNNAALRRVGSYEDRRVR